MRWLTEIWLRFRGLVWRTRLDRDLDTEMEFHLRMRQRELEESGTPPAEARRAASRRFGNKTLIQERGREMFGFVSLEGFYRDIRYAVRTLARSPGFTLVALITLTLGIGANTAMFQLFETVRLRSLPVERPEELVMVRIRGEGRSGNFRGRNGQFTYPVWDALRRNQKSFAGLLAYGDTPLNLASSGELRSVEGLWVSGTFFPVLGIRPHLGRLLGTNDDRPGCGSPGVVISHAFWQREFGGDAGVLSRTLPIEGQAVPILGVTQPTFFGVEVGRRFDVAMPLCSAPESMLGDRMLWFLSVMARRKPGFGEDASRAELRSLSPSVFEATVPPFQPGLQSLYTKLQLDVEPGAEGQSGFRDSLQRPLPLLLCLVAFVLLLACTNLANMLLARASAREHEFAVRRSLGASRWRLMRQVMIESLMLAFAGAVLGALAAPVLSRALVAMLSTPRDPIHLPLNGDWRVAAAAIAAAVAATLLFGSAPALRAGSADTRGTSASREKHLFRRVLLGAQAALCMVLLTSALLFSSSFRNLVTASPGFRAEGMLVANVFLDGKRYSAEGRRPVIEDMQERIRAVPGVLAVARSYVIPISGSGWDRGARVSPSDSPQIVNLTSVSEGYFRVMNAQLLAGRDFNAADRPGSTPVAIVNQAFARVFFSGRNPVGKTFRLDGPEPPLEIVGLTTDSKYRALAESFTPIAYLAASQEQPPRTTVRFLVRSSGSPEHLIHSLKQVLQEVDPRLFMRFTVLQAQLEESVLREKLMAVLFGAFGVLGAMLALTGVFGVTAYIVSRRYREFGVRIALGATRGGIVRLVLSEITGVTIGGIVLGGLLVLVTGSAASTLLYGVKPYDVPILTAVTLLLASGGLLAALIPALRASRVVPVEALRKE